MLKVVIPSSEFYDERTSEFIPIKETTLQLEHSLVSISKWESKWKKPFLTKDQKTREELLDYVRCMTINQNVDDNVYLALSPKEFKRIVEYLDDPYSATVINEIKIPGIPQKRSSEFITSELVYYWMVALQIPFECQKWNFNRLMTLIRICEIKNGPKKKMSKQQILSQNAALNKARREALNTKG